MEGYEGKHKVICDNITKIITLLRLWHPLLILNRIWEDISLIVECLLKLNGFNSILIIVDRLANKFNFLLSNIILQLNKWQKYFFEILCIYMAFRFLWSLLVIKYFWVNFGRNYFDYKVFISTNQVYIILNQMNIPR